MKKMIKYFYSIYTIKEFYKLLYKHLKERWNIDYKTIKKYLNLFFISIIIFTILDFVYINFVIFKNNSFNLFRIQYFDINIIISESIIFSLILFFKFYMNSYNVIKEIKYTFFNIKFSYLLYHYLLDKYFENFNNKTKKEIFLEFKLLNFLFLHCFNIYFKNTKYLDSDYIIKCIFGFSKLYNNDKKISNDLREFLCISFFNPHKKKNMSHHQSFVSTLNRQIRFISKFKNLNLESLKINELVDFVLTRWYISVIKFSLK